MDSMKFQGLIGIIFYFLILFLIKQFIGFEIAVLIGLAAIFYGILHLVEEL